MKTKNNTCHSELISESSSFLKPNKLKTKTYGFTLVELIVVITILTILGTIGFTQMQGYSSSARDSMRTSDLANLTKGLEVFQIKTGSYPIPVNSVVYTGGVSGGSIISQGTLNGTLVGFSVSNPSDPITKTSYVYSVLGNGSYYQIGAELENPLSGISDSPNIVSQAYADGIKTPLLKGNYSSDPSLPSLVIVPGSVPTTVGSGGIFSPEVCFVTGGSSSNTLSSGTGTCTKKKAMSLKNSDSALVGYWDMETTFLSGGVNYLKDLSGNGNDGMCYNSGITTNCGDGTTGPQVINNSIYFNGIDKQYIVVKDNEKLEIGKNGTIFVKFKITGPSGLFSASVDYAKILTKDDIGGTLCQPNTYVYNNHVTLLVNPSYTGSSLSLVGTDSRIFCNLREDLPLISPENIYNYDYNYFNILSNGNTSSYLNGNKIFEKSNGLYSIPDTNDDWKLGAGHTYYLNGLIDEVKIYNKALSNSEIKQQSRTMGF